MQEDFSPLQSIAPDEPTPESEAIGVVGTDTDEQPSDDQTDAERVKARRTAVGRVAHFVGLLVAAVIGKSVGATRSKRLANHHVLDGTPFQIRTITGSQKTFTINPSTEPEPIIVSVRQRLPAAPDMAHYQLYGVLKTDVIPRSKKSASPGHLKSLHRQASITQVPKTLLGHAMVPRRLITCSSTEERFDRLTDIDGASPEQLVGVMDEETRAHIRSFIASAKSPSGPQPAEPVPPSAGDVCDAADSPLEP